jgi:hypothetical protein
MQGLGIRLAAAAVLCAYGATADAAGPKLSGKYAFVVTTFCAATLEALKSPGVKQITLNGGDVTQVVTQQITRDVAPKDGGMISSGIGYITFNSPAPGQLTISGSTLVEGAALRVKDKSSFAWSSHPDNQSGVPFSNTATTFTFGSGEEAEVYQMVYADPLESNPAVYRTAYLMRRSTSGDELNPNPDCVTNVQATRQAD